MASRLGLKNLTSFSRQLGTMLNAGLPIRRALAVVERSARSPMKGIFHRVGIAIEQGDSVSDALKREGGAFPLLYIRLVRMGEVVGNLDKVFSRLAEYYEFVRAMWMRLISSLTYPILEYFAAVGVLSLATYILDMVDTAKMVPRPIPGLSGVMVLVVGILLFAAPIAAYFAATRLFGGLRATHEIMLRIPVVGNVMRALALARFSWSMELMTDAGVNIFDALQWSMEATANGAFEGQTPTIIQNVKDGVALSESLRASGLFPHDYLEMMHVGEESGSMPDMFKRLAQNYFEQAERALSALTTVLGWCIWICVAAVIIFFIFRFFSMYIGSINSMMPGVIIFAA
jgi:type IV pilus assembly protein PilC